MPEFQMESTLDMPADRLWAVLRDFGDVSWLPGAPEPVFDGEGIGMIRSVVIPPLPTARERLEKIDEAERRIDYEVVDGNPMPVKNYRASMQAVEIDGERSRLVWRSTWDPDGVSEEEAMAAVGDLYRNVLRLAKKNLESR